MKNSEKIKSNIMNLIDGVESLSFIQSANFEDKPYYWNLQYKIGNKKEKISNLIEEFAS